MKPSEVESGIQRGEEFRRFWDEVCGAGREDEGAMAQGKRDADGGLGRRVRDRLRVVGLDARCESPMCMWCFVEGV